MQWFFFLTFKKQHKAGINFLLIINKFLLIYIQMNLATIFFFSEADKHTFILFHLDFMIYFFRASTNIQLFNLKF